MHKWELEFIFIQLRKVGAFEDPWVLFVMQLTGNTAVGTCKNGLSVCAKQHSFAQHCGPWSLSLSSLIAKEGKTNFPLLLDLEIRTTAVKGKFYIYYNIGTWSGCCMKDKQEKPQHRILYFLGYFTSVCLLSGALRCSSSWIFSVHWDAEKQQTLTETKDCKQQWRFTDCCFVLSLSDPSHCSHFWQIKVIHVCFCPYQ